MLACRGMDRPLMLEVSLSIFGAVLGLMALAGAVWGKFRTSADESTLAVWKGEAEAQKARADRLEAGLADLTRRMAALEDENRVLRSLYDSREEMTQLRRVMTDGFTTLALLLKESR